MDNQNINKQESQKRLLSENTFIYKGNGPGATGRGSGWRMGKEIYFKCIKCGYYMSAADNNDTSCFCGALYKDIDYGRFGSRFGDNSVEVYEIKRKK